MQRFDALCVREAIRCLLVEQQLPPGHADDVADSLVDASLRGIDTHGVHLLGTYLKELDGGRAKRQPQFTVQGGLPAVGVFDVDHALGVVGAAAAMRETMARARQFGIAALAVRNSNHFGRADYFARMASASGQIGLVFSNSDALVIPVGGIEPLNGTNPLAMAAPGIDDDGFFLDMATSQTAYSRVLQALQSGQALEPGLAANELGLDASAGGGVATLQPLGGIKGQGLGTMIQILCALLSTMPLDAELTHLYCPPYDRPRLISHFLIAIEIGAFVDLELFRTRLTELLNRFRDSPPAGESAVMVAGDFERRTHQNRRRDGIPISAADFALIAAYMPDIAAV